MAVLGMLLTACHKMGFNSNDLRNFEQIDLVANASGYGAPTIDPTLRNGWGLAWSPTGIAWVNSEAGGVSELYTGEGAIVRPPVLIPSPKDTMGGMPTGIVFNSTKGFMLPDSAIASFIFIGVDGVLSAWNGKEGNKAVRIKDLSATSAYTGLTQGWDNGRNLLYATNFRVGRVEACDTAWKGVVMTFRDPDMPAGYAPYNIQAIESWLFVSYAKVGPDGHEEIGAGNGFVDIYNTDGSFVRRFASRGALNAPWGMTMAPAGWLNTTDMGSAVDNGGSGSDGSSGKKVGPVILIGNFGDGRINVYSQQGQYLGALKSHNRPIEIYGLWAIGFAPSTATSIDPARLYFTAGPNNQSDGIFGYIAKE